MASVCVLLSTYNGEKYLSEQLDSLLAQMGIELHVLIRDDGSSDSTMDIIKSYAEKHAEIAYYRGENKGPGMSFLDLMSHADEYDYYAFCDQDDVWDSDKLEAAVNMLAPLDTEKPAMYYSNLNIVDETLIFYRKSHSAPHIIPGKYSALVENMATGCTVVFNKAALKLTRSHLPENCILHDEWLFIICNLFGNVVYDYDAHISYRQHESNVLGTYLKKDNLAAIKSGLKRVTRTDLQPRYNNALRVWQCFRDELTEEDTEKVQKIVNYKNSFGCKWKLLTDRDIRARGVVRDVCYRLLIIRGLA